MLFGLTQRKTSTNFFSCQQLLGIPRCIHCTKKNSQHDAPIHFIRTCIIHYISLLVCVKFKQSSSKSTVYDIILTKYRNKILNNYFFKCFLYFGNNLLISLLKITQLNLTKGICLAFSIFCHLYEIYVSVTYTYSA